jgi:hypothetical protein
MANDGQARGESTDAGLWGAEEMRLERQRLGHENWRLWGPYLSERAWGTVREDYSAQGDVWGNFPHEQARSRAYRWSEDGLAGISDERQRLCFALALWNSRDSMLKERAFGLTGEQGNRGEDVKEYYFYLDATPSHSFLRYLYKYPHSAFPYERLLVENERRTRLDPPFNLIDTGAFAEDRYFDVVVLYAKLSPVAILIRIVATNCGPEAAELHLLPTLWFRNTWSWGDGSAKPAIRVIDPPEGAAWAVDANHADLGRYRLTGRQEGALLFTDNDTNNERLWGGSNATSFVKDAFHRRVIEGASDTVNPARTGTKFALWRKLTLAPGESAELELALAAEPKTKPFERFEAIFAAREREADRFYDALFPRGSGEDRRILRQAFAGMIWTKQFFHYDVERWLAGDRHKPPASRLRGRNNSWRHVKAADVISMPDAWEYPWFAAWDLAFHCCALALIDVDFAKDQIELMLIERYLHPNGQMPAYEWNFNDVNPPVHAFAALKAFRAERARRGAGDHAFLERVFIKLLLNYAWWLNRKDVDGANIFEGGFLGLDNISVFNRSQSLPPGYALKQADATGWMAMFALNMTVIALELTQTDPNYEGIAIQLYEQFLSICEALAGHASARPSIWDAPSGFFKDLIVGPDGSWRHIDVYSMVGLIPLFATEVVDARLLGAAPRFRERLRMHKGGLFRGAYVCACPDWENERGEHLLSIVDHTMIQPILSRLLDEQQFLSAFGVRSVSKYHERHTDLGVLPGVGEAMIEYIPGESISPLFGGNSNWRGPIWLPVNYLLMRSIQKFHRFLGDGFAVVLPCAGQAPVTLADVAHLIAERVLSLYRRDEKGMAPAMRAQPQFGFDAHWRDLLLFYEYFHAETGQGLGACHQTGWTGLIANLLLGEHCEDAPSPGALETAEEMGRVGWRQDGATFPLPRP